jgi:hypothetical protein
MAVFVTGNSNPVGLLDSNPMPAFRYACFWEVKMGEKPVDSSQALISNYFPATGPLSFNMHIPFQL